MGFLNDVRTIVDPLILRLKEELYGSGISYGRISTNVLPTTIVYETNITQILDADGYFTDPTTTNGDMIVRSGGAIHRFPAGANGKFLSVVGGLPTWSNPPSGTDPTTDEGDMIYRRSSTIRLPIGTSGQILTVVSGYPEWAAPPAGFTNPMTTAGDLIYGTTAGAATRLPIGTNNYVLTVVSGSPTWMPSSGSFTNPLTTVGDLLFEDTGPSPNRLPIGSSGQVLTVISGKPSWQTPSTGLTNPMTTLDDIIIAASGGTPTRLAKGSENQTLTIVGGHVAWSTPASSPVAPSALYLDAIPASGHALDDEFNGTTFDAKWSDISSGTGLQLSKTVANGWLLMEPPGSGSSSTGKYLMGIRQNAPTGSFSVMVKFADSRGGDDVRAGVMVSDGTRFHVCGSNRSAGTNVAAIGGNTYSETADAGSYDGFYSTAGSNTIYHAFWAKIKWDASASTLYFYWSQNGVHWEQITSRSGMNQPTRVGIAIWSQNAGTIAADHSLGIDWFRVTEP